MTLELRAKVERAALAIQTYSNPESQYTLLFSGGKDSLVLRAVTELSCVPHEAIYNDLLMNSGGALKDEDENLIQRAASKYKVIIVSPTSFLAYLQTVLQGLRGMEIEEKAKEIQKWVGELGKHLKAYEDYNTGLGAALGTVINKYNFASKEFKKIDKDVYKISGAAAGLEAPLLEKPLAEE